MKSSYTDEQIIELVKTGGTALTPVLHYLYHHSGYRGRIMQLIQQKSGSREDAEDIFQDGIRHLVVNIRHGKFRASSSIQSYLTRICLNLWHTQFNRSVRLRAIKQELPQEEQVADSPEDVVLYQERAQLLENTLSQLGEPCKKVLGLWALSYSMKEIAKQTNYKNEAVVRKKKHQCFQQLMKLLYQRPELMQQLLALRES